MSFKELCNILRQHTYFTNVRTERQNETLQYFCPNTSILTSWQCWMDDCWYLKKILTQLDSQNFIIIKNLSPFITCEICLFALFTLQHLFIMVQRQTNLCYKSLFIDIIFNLDEVNPCFAFNGSIAWRYTVS